MGNGVTGCGASYFLGHQSAAYYRIIAALCDRWQLLHADIAQAVHRLDLVAGSLLEPEVAFFAELNSTLAPFTAAYPDFVAALPASKAGADYNIARVEYHRRMLAIELRNRYNRAAFLAARNYIIFLPHCLRDFRTGCAYYPGEYDYKCGQCDHECACYQVSELFFARMDVTVLIAVNRDQEQLFARIKAEVSEVALVGVACVPDLYLGLRLCEKLNIPAQAIPMDGNCCRRWYGKARETGFNINQLAELFLA